MTTKNQETPGLDLTNIENDKELPYNSRVRVFKKYALQHHRSDESVANQISDEELFYCETHGITRICESNEVLIIR